MHIRSWLRTGQELALKRQVVVFGLLGGVLIALLQLIEYRFLVLAHSRDAYGGLVAAVFSLLGIWLGLRVNRPGARRAAALAPPTPPGGPFVRDTARVDSLRITRRELEILELIAEGLSNRDIAERIFVSENTVKTHASRLFEKLDARRRTQAVQIAKQYRLIP